jgi:hypothetical protein
LIGVRLPFIRSFPNDESILGYRNERLDGGEPSATLMPLSTVVELRPALVEMNWPGGHSS